MTPHVVECREFAFADVDADLLMSVDGRGFDINQDAERRGAFALSVKNGEVRLQAGSLVGIIPVNDRLWLRVTPRVPVGNLERLIRTSGHTPIQISGLRRYSAGGEIEDWLYDVYATFLEPAIEELLERGVYRTYRRREAVGSSPRGRIDFARTMSRFAARGIAYRADFSWFERTPDNAPNQLIKLALQVLHRHYSSGLRGATVKSGYRQHSRRLVKLLESFDRVSNVSPFSVLSAPEIMNIGRIPDERYYYRDVLAASALLVGERGLRLDRSDDGILLDSLLINMSDVFERYVRGLLADAAQQWRVDVLDGNGTGHRPLYADSVSTPVLELFGSDLVGDLKQSQRKDLVASPDIVVSDPNGDTRVICEVKYTLPKSAVPPRDELDQALTYALTHNVRLVVLVHPCPSHRASGLTFVGSVGDVQVFDYRFDLGADDLQAEEQAWSTAIHDLAEHKALRITA